MTNDTFHTYIFDAEGNITAVDSGQTATYVYNAQNQRVRATVGSAITEYVFSAAGQRVSEWNGTTRAQLKGKYYWGAKPVAYYAGGAAHFEHQDWLGTERVRTTYNGGVEASTISLPFGDGQATTGADGDANHYGMLDADPKTATDHAQFRQYSEAQGRWLAPDPYSGSYSMRNPQSFNRYVYASNNPLAMTDASGLCDIWSIVGWSSCLGGKLVGLGGGGGGGGGGASSSTSDGGVMVTTPNGQEYLYQEQYWNDEMQNGYGAGIWLSNGTSGEVMVTYDWSTKSVDTGVDVDLFPSLDLTGLNSDQIPKGNVTTQQSYSDPLGPIHELAVNVVRDVGLYDQTPVQAHAQKCAGSLGLIAASYPVGGESIWLGRALWGIGLGTNFVPNWGCSGLPMPPP